MFHRRLLLLGAVVALCAAPLAAQLARLTLGQGEQLRAEAESKLQQSRWTPTRRGRILDRQGRVLAVDRPSYDVAVAYPVITSEWAVRRAGSYARRRHREAWPKLSAFERDGLIATYLPAYERHLDEAWERLAEATETDPDVLRQRRERVVASVERACESIVARRADAERRERIARGSEITAEIEERISELSERPIREQRDPHVLVPRVPDDISFDVQRLADERVELFPGGPDQAPDMVERAPGLVVMDARDRLYPMDRLVVPVDPSTFPSPIASDRVFEVEVFGVAAHIIGWLSGDHTAEDVERREVILSDRPTLDARVRTPAGSDRGRYRPGDLVGRAGIERSGEPTLRGLRGLRTTRLDTGETLTLESEAGRDIRLTIDAALQARVQALMTPEVGLAQVQPFHHGTAPANPTMPDGTPINGAAVVLHIDTAEILAMVSMPALDRELLRTDPMVLYEDVINRPAVNRCISVPYQPGSIVKALLVPSARALGHLAAGEAIECTGHYLPDRRDVYRCWIYKRFGVLHQGEGGYGLRAARALEVSCNIFFYELGKRLGAEGLTKTYEWFGLGEPFGLGVGPEFTGSIGALGTGRLDRSDQIFMGIGQGPVAWTPLHAAEALATLARDGVRLKPRLLLEAPTADPVELDLPRDAIDDALEGLRRSLNESDGTGHHITLPDIGREVIFNAPGLSIWGKTGTATASPLVADLDGDGENERVREGDHSWFVLLAGPEGGGPEYAVAVVMEYAGSGGRVSGPVANQILHALIAEGYLP